MDSLDSNKKIAILRNGQPLGEYPLRELTSLLETGALKIKDQCYDPESKELRTLPDFLSRVKISGSTRSSEATELWQENLEENNHRRAWAGAISLLFLTFAVVLGATLWIGQLSAENTQLRDRLARAETGKEEMKKAWQDVMFAAREVASSDLVRGRVILRDATGKRVALPGVKVRLYSRAAIEAHLAAQAATKPETTDATRMSAHFLTELPAAIDNTTTNSDGRFECRIPEPGEYILQTSIRSAKNGAMRLWFVAFDSRDPLNTPVDITEGNVVQQFNPVFMIADGR